MQVSTANRRTGIGREVAEVEAPAAYAAFASSISSLIATARF